MYHFVVALVLIALYAGQNSVAATPVDEDIVYQASNYYQLPPNEYEMPASCASDTYCFDKGENYPDDKIAALLEDMRVTPVKGEPELNIMQIGYRGGDETNEHPDCPSNNTYMYQPIYYILDASYDVRVVVQSPAHQFQQIYTVKWCQKPGPITEDTTHFMKETLQMLSQTFSVECVDTIMDFDFFVLSKDGNYIETVQAGIPVFCRCRYSNK